MKRPSDQLEIGSSPSESHSDKKQNTMSGDNLQSMKYSNEGGLSPQLKVLDQLLIPHEKVYIDVPSVEMAYTVIKTMQIRGGCARAGVK